MRDRRGSQLARAQITLQGVQALLAADRREEAVAALQQLVRREPHAPGVRLLAAQLAAADGDHERAISHARAALETSGDDLRATRLLASSLSALERHAEAIAVYERMLDADPSNEKAMMSLSGSYLRADRLADAEAIMERAARDRGDVKDVWHEYALLYLCTGRATEAMAILDRAAIRFPEASDIAVTQASVSNYVPELSPERVRAAHARAARLMEPELAAISHANTPDPDRPLTVGFVSGDFHNHSISYFLLPILESLDRSRIKPELFWTGRSRDATTARFEALAPMHACRGRRASEVAAEIRQRGVDVLVDLSGYTMDHGLQVFALRPAPVQLSAIGYPASTGLRGIDARLADSITDPPEQDPLDRVLRLDPCFLCYQAPKDAPEPRFGDPERPPTFGSFNAIQKLNPALLSLWTELLRSVPGSRLTLKADLRLTAVVSRIRGTFERAGIESDRLSFFSNTRTPQEARSLYEQIDVALDTHPYNGTTTTCESLLMGVPVVTLAGHAHVQRVSSSLLAAVGLQELVATTTEDYLRIARELVLDRARVLDYRKTLRPRMLASALCDAGRYTASFERVLRGAWRTWCAGKTSADAS